MNKHGAIILPALAALALGASGRAVADTILDLQDGARVSTLALDVAGARGVATLTNLNPRINVWYLLTLEWDGAGAPATFHLENTAPLHQVIELDADTGRGLTVRTDLDAFGCELWPTRAALPLEQARRTGSSYAPLCEERLYLRNSSSGYRTGKELVTEFLRDRVWGGERIIGLVKSTLERDAHLERSSARLSSEPVAGAAAGPRPASIEAAGAGLRAVPGGLGIGLELPVPGRVAFGQWYPVRTVADVYVSVTEPGLTEAALLGSHRDRVRALDDIEARALAYLVAFDLERLSLGYEVGTDHPRVGWSERALQEVREQGLSGPDDIDSIGPLAATGIVNPAHVPRTIATFTGGFKRTHGAFRYGELARKNRGSHYGWVQNGVVFSTLRPELPTLVVREHGAVEMKTWQPADQWAFGPIKHARQNGVPLIEPDPDSGDPVPGALVGNWGAGNWSGSASGEQRTVRGGVCLQDGEAGRFLVYGYFSSATPSAMARVFQAYGCRYAMLLDMNALEHTYFALYDVDEAGINVQHLVKGMEAVDRMVGGRAVPRFIGYPDNRDFFYVLRKSEDEP